MAKPPPDYVPPPSVLFIRKHIWVLAFLSGIITLTVLRPFMRHIPDPPPILFSLPDYELVDQRGEAFTPDTLQDKVWVAGFVFTRCPSSCPAVTRAMVELRARFDRMDIEVEMVSISVDPENDTPDVLAKYAAEVGADNERWRFVTGDRAAIEELVVKGFRLGVGEPEQQPGGLYDIAHSTKLALVDEAGNVRGFYDIDATPYADGGLDELFERADRVLAAAKDR